MNELKQKILKRANEAAQTSDANCFSFTMKNSELDNVTSDDKKCDELCMLCKDMGLKCWPNLFTDCVFFFTNDKRPLRENPYITPQSKVHVEDDLEGVEADFEMVKDHEENEKNKKLKIEQELEEKKKQLRANIEQAFMSAGDDATMILLPESEVDDISLVDGCYEVIRAYMRAQDGTWYMRIRARTPPRAQDDDENAWFETQVSLETYLRMQIEFAIKRDKHNWYLELPAEDLKRFGPGAEVGDLVVNLCKENGLRALQLINEQRVLIIKGDAKPFVFDANAEWKKHLAMQVLREQVVQPNAFHFLMESSKYSALLSVCGITNVNAALAELKWWAQSNVVVAEGKWYSIFYTQNKCAFNGAEFKLVHEKTPLDKLLQTSMRNAAPANSFVISRHAVGNTLLLNQWCETHNVSVTTNVFGDWYVVFTNDGAPFKPPSETDKVSFADKLREKTEEHFVKDKKQRDAQLEEFKKEAKKIMFCAATNGFRICTLSKTSHNCLVSQKQVQEMANEMGVQMCNNYSEYEFFWYTAQEYEAMKSRVLSS